jgi:hypothetical protein
MSLNNNIIKSIYFGTRIILIISIIYFIFQQDWVSLINTSAILLLIIAPSILKNKYDFYFPLELDVIVGIFLFISLFLGSVQDYYEKYPLMDGILHLKSGILLGVLGFVLVYVLNKNSKNDKLNLNPLFISIFAIMFSLGISVFWEIYEYTIDTVWGFKTQESGLPDTMGDFIVNTVGALIVSISGYFWMKKSKKVPFTPGDLD